MEVTGHDQLAAWRDRRLPPVEEVRPDLWSIPLPNKESGIRYVLAYAFVHDGGVTVVDPGWRDRDSWDALAEGLARFGRSIADVRSIVVTHFHPDHLGLADLVAEKSGARVLMHRAELPCLPGSLERAMAETEPFLREHGLPVPEIEHFQRDPEGLGSFAELRPPDGFVEDGEWLDIPGRRVQAIRTAGHTPGHLCLHLPDERVLLTGDHLLPRITPNISAFPNSGTDPLGDYLASLRRTAELDVHEVLPAHEYRFAGMADRIGVIQRHHEDREAELCDILAAAPGPVTASEVSRLLSWSRPFDEIAIEMRRSALAEALAHLVFLAGRQRVVRADRVPGEARWTLPGR